MYFNQLETQPELYLETLRNKNYSAETIKNYNTSISKFIKFGLAEEVAELYPDTINQTMEKYQTYLSTSESYSYSTVNQYLTNLKPFFNNLGFGFKVKKVNTEVNPEIKYLTLKEIGEVLFTIDKLEKNHFKKMQYKALVRFIFYTGARIKEVEKLRVNDIKKDKTSYYVSSSMVKIIRP